MPYGAVFSREQLLNWLMGKGPSPETPFLGTPEVTVPPGQCIVLADEPRADGSTGWVIGVASRDLRDFLAWTSTYATSFTPFTAFFRVVALPELDRIINARASRSVVPRELVALPIAEAFVSLQGRAQRVDDVTLSAVGGTLSWTLLDGLFAGSIDRAPSEIIDRWLHARRLTGGPEPIATSIAAVNDVWRVAIAKLHPHLRRPRDEGEERAIAAYELAADAGGLNDELWRVLSGSSSAVTSAYGKMRGPRENRTRALSGLFDDLIKEKNLPSHYRDCLAGALMALLADGSFRYLPLAASSTSELPGLSLWFALWSSTFKGTDVFVEGGCLGRHLAKRLPSTFDKYAPPVDDIALDELALKEPDEISALRTAQQSTIAIELLPGVSAKFRRQPLSRNEQSPEEILVSEADITELRTLSRRIDALAQRFDKRRDGKENRGASTRSTGRAKRGS